MHVTSRFGGAGERLFFLSPCIHVSEDMDGSVNEFNEWSDSLIYPSDTTCSISTPKRGIAKGV